MDSNECRTTIPAGRDTVGLSAGKVVEQLRRANQAFARESEQFRSYILDK